MTNPVWLLARTDLARATPLFVPDQRADNPFVLLLVIIIVAVCLLATLILLVALLPQVSRQSQAALRRSPWRAFFIGLVNYLFLGGIIAVVSQAGIGWLNLLALLLLLGLTAVTALGLSGLVTLAGERVAALHSQAMSPLKQTIWGALLLELACLLPFAGWFLLTPLLLMISFGAAVLAWRQH